MISTPPTDRQQELLDLYNQASGVAEFIFIDCDEKDGDIDSPSTHQLAVKHGIQNLYRDLEDWANVVSQSNGIDRESFFRITTDDKPLVPTRVSKKEFLGPRFDHARGGLIVQGKAKLHNEFFFYRDEVCVDNIIPQGLVDDGFGPGFAYVFSDPPYGMSIDTRELGQLFNSFLSEVLKLSDNSVIYQWPTDWSNFFDAGHEWWGAFLWSLSIPDTRRILIIAASSTD